MGNFPFLIMSNVEPLRILDQRKTVFKGDNSGRQLCGGWREAYREASEGPVLSREP